jgi:hypothetical protein
MEIRFQMDHFNKGKFLLLVILIPVFLLIFQETSAQNYENEKVNKILSETNSGKDFWFSPILYWKEYDQILKGKKTGIYRLYVQSKSKAKVSLEIGSKSFKKEIEVDKYKPGVIQLSDSLAQVILSYHFIDSVEYLHDFNIPCQTFEKSGIHITSDNEISVFVYMYFKYESNAYSLIPTENLGNEYILSSYNAIPIGMSGGYFPSIATFTATHDNTILNIKIGGNSRTSIQHKNNTKFKYGDSLIVNLNSGDVFYMQCDNRDTTQDLSGTLVKSNYPVSVVSGVMCAQIPVRTASCNCISEMATSTKFWGKKFLIPAFKNRKLYGLVRIYAKEPNTVIYRDGKFFDSIPFNNNIGSNFIERRIYSKIDSITKKYIPISNSFISSNNKISITYLNPGFADEEGIFTGKDYDMNTDPFKLEILPIEQFTRSADILLPTTTSNSALLNQNYTDIIFPTSENLQIPDDIFLSRMENNQEINIPLKDLYTGKIDAFPLKDKDNYYNRITLITDSIKQFSLSSKKSKFVAYCYGYDVQDTYAFIAARNFLDSIDLTPPYFSGEMDCNGTFEGYFYDYIINEDSKIIKIELDSLMSTNFKLHYLPDSLNVDSVYFKLEVINPYLNGYAVIHITDGSGNDTTYYFEYIGLNERERIVFPNPSDNKIINVKIFTCEANIATIEIWDYIGRKYKSFDNIALTKGMNTITLNLQELSQGAYFMVITKPKPRTIHKFIFVSL